MTFDIRTAILGTGCENCKKRISQKEQYIIEIDIERHTTFRCLPCGKKAIVKEFEKLNKLYARINNGEAFFNCVVIDEASDIDKERLSNIMNKGVIQKVLDKEMKEVKEEQ